MTHPFDLAAAQDLDAILREAARAEILPRFRRLAQGAVRTKSGPQDLVTDADEAAERQITAALEARFPGCLVIGEEAAERDPALLDRLEAAELAFVVDPVDGTSNFAAGLPLFGVMAAAIRHGEIIGAAIHDPMGDDTALAVRGQGAWIADATGQRTAELRVAEAKPVAEMAAAISWRYLAPAMKASVVPRMTAFASVVSFRCAAHEYRAAAAGHLDMLFYNRLMPWDHAPGWLLHQEAGGFSAQFDASPYRPASRSGGLIMAPNRAAWEAAREALLGGYEP
ncbi:fructose-1,6-bisphosphatase/inositol monophosphatase family enzyme [Humitalea rosea]|uniref:Fructose-1,6-bisphosphatase/inositol monophosphatase family enzyme n=1 Tax=Humitalea rosea TaxID=990373 RepID=A0A2W7IWD8_9PROT|nr:inositol monophosphatase [Humitalea rosea]PZW51068.1 fructose-1,6-bisphosphatase/inositol monophosphatase family enzyme [Humitalea rosea]